MCTMFWTLRNVPFVCPACGWDTFSDLQTHFMGDFGSCLNYYKVGEKVKEATGITTLLGDAERGCPDDFIGHCDLCGVWIDFAARIESGVVLGAWPYRYRDADQTIWKLSEDDVWLRA